ncbi:MAG: hypothetical protein ACQEQJ_01780 [Halobacteriota archaeon]
MSAATHQIRGLELDDDQYEIEQALVRNKYVARDSTGDVVLRGSQKRLKLKEQFPFEDSDGTDVFEVKADSIADVAGEYALIDSQTGERVVVLDNQWSWMGDQWKIRDPTTEALIAVIETQNRAVEFLRHLHSVFGFVPHAYEISDPRGNHVGTIEGQLGLKDRYDVEIEDASEVPREPVIAAAMVIDAIEGN